MRQKKYNFIQEDLLKGVSDAPEYTVNITGNGSIYFSSFIVKAYELKNKIIRVYVDKEKKSIAWTEITGGDLNSLKNIRQLKVNSEKNQNIVLMVLKLLKNIGITKEMLPIKKIPVITYKDSFIEGDLHVVDLSSYAKTKNKTE